MHKDFFISRAGADKDIALFIAEVLKEAGFTTWLQDEDFGHASFMARMADGYSSSAKMVALLSLAYQKSEHCKAEYEHILTDDPRNRKERLLVLRIEECTPVEHLKNLAYTDLVPMLNDAAALKQVVREVTGIDSCQSEKETEDRLDKIRMKLRRIKLLRREQLIDDEIALEAQRRIVQDDIIGS